MLVWPIWDGRIYNRVRNGVVAKELTMMTVLAKLTDILGILTSAYLAVFAYSVISGHFSETSVAAEMVNDGGGTAYVVVIGLIFASIYGFYRSFSYKPNKKLTPIPPWSGGRLLAWPLLALAFGMSNLLLSSIS